ncbi:MAG: hypothetical protein EZS28_051231, partial [Streblomastix strix]
DRIQHGSNLLWKTWSEESADLKARLSQQENKARELDGKLHYYQEKDQKVGKDLAEVRMAKAATEQERNILQAEVARLKNQVALLQRSVQEEQDIHISDVNGLRTINASHAQALSQAQLHIAHQQEEIQQLNTTLKSKDKIISEVDKHEKVQEQKLIHEEERSTKYQQENDDLKKHISYQSKIGEHSERVQRWNRLLRNTCSRMAKLLSQFSEYKDFAENVVLGLPDTYAQPPQPPKSTLQLIKKQSKSNSSNNNSQYTEEIDSRGIVKEEETYWLPLDSFICIPASAVSKQNKSSDINPITLEDMPLRPSPYIPLSAMPAILLEINRVFRQRE